MAITGSIIGLVCRHMSGWMFLSVAISCLIPWMLLRFKAPDYSMDVPPEPTPVAAAAVGVSNNSKKRKKKKRQKQAVIEDVKPPVVELNKAERVPVEVKSRPPKKQIIATNPIQPIKKEREAVIRVRQVIREAEDKNVVIWFVANTNFTKHSSSLQICANVCGNWNSNQTISMTRVSSESKKVQRWQLRCEIPKRFQSFEYRYLESYGSRNIWESCVTRLVDLTKDDQVYVSGPIHFLNPEDSKMRSPPTPQVRDWIAIAGKKTAPDPKTVSAFSIWWLKNRTSTESLFDAVSLNASGQLDEFVQQM